MDTVKIAAAFRALAEAFESEPAAVVAAVVTPVVRGRGRPPKAVAVVEAAEPDAFAAPAVLEVPPAAPTATLEEVRAALTALRAATSQDKALSVLVASSGAANLTALTSDKYGAVVAAVKAAMPAAAPVAKAPEADPFAIDANAPGAAPAKVLTLEDVKAAVIAAQKRTGQDTVQKVVMEHGGKAASPDGGAMMPSLKALPPSAFGAVLKALGELPSTK